MKDVGKDIPSRYEGRGTVPFHSIHQSHVTGPQKFTKCYDGHGHFGEVTKSFR